MSRGKYRWDKELGVVEVESDDQILQVLAVNCTKKFRNRAGGELVRRLNWLDINDRMIKERRAR